MSRPGADLVLSARSDDAVDVWRMPGHEGIKLALFLQFHGAGGEALPENTARVRFAYRNFYPQTFTFQRELSADGGTLGPHSKQTRLLIRAARVGKIQEDIIQDVVPLQRESDDAVVDAAIQITEPETLNHIRDELSVKFTRGKRHRCPCCSQSFPS